MRRKRAPVLLVTLIIVLCVAAYMGYYIVRAFSSRITVSEAVIATAEDTLTVNGWFARDEYRVYLDGGVDEYVVSEGEKVSKGEVVAVTYQDGSAAGVNHKLGELEASVAELKKTASLTAGEDLSKSDAEVSSSIYALSYAVSRGEYSGLSEKVSGVKSSVISRDYVHGKLSREMLDTEIAALETQITSLSGQAYETSASLRAATSGYFSSSADGYEETLTYESVLEMTPSDIDALASLEVQVEDNCCGKISTTFGWHYATAVSEQYADMLEQNKWYTLRFSGGYVGEVSARLKSVSEPEDGRCVLVFSCSNHISELINMRRQNAEIVLKTYEGIRVPKSAIRVGEDGENGVYVLLSAQSRFVRVEQIYEADNYYIVTYDPTSSSALRPGDEIIVSSKELYDGKVVE